MPIHKTKIFFLYMGLFAWLQGCKNLAHESNSAWENQSVVFDEITSRFDPEENWRDIHLKIISYKSTDTTRIYTCKGLHKGKTVGLQVGVRSDISAGITHEGELSSQLGLVKNAIQMKSIGKESDEFIKALSDLYGKPTMDPFIKQTKWLTAFSLNQRPVDLDKKDYYKLRIFFDLDENLYSELYFNINTQTQEIELNEKDEEYREGVISMLTQ